MEQNKRIENIGNYGAMLSLIEVGLGSILHAFHVPFSGIFLSLNQGYLLCRLSLVSERSDRFTSYAVSNVAAILKSLSPAGQKLGPMLSLSMQGLLFNLGTLLFGVNVLGLSLGMILLSFWSFVQPLVTYYLFFGDTLLSALDFLYQKTFPYHELKTDDIARLFFVIVGLKALVGIILAIIAIKAGGESPFQERLTEIAKQKSPKANLNKSPFVLALIDLTRPFFLISLLITGIFLYYSNHQSAEIIWYLMRPIAVGFIFFYFSRTLTLDRLLKKLEGGRFEGFAKATQFALVQIRKVI